MRHGLHVFVLSSAACIQPNSSMGVAQTRPTAHRLQHNTTNCSLPFMPFCDQQKLEARAQCEATAEAQADRVADLTYEPPPSTDIYNTFWIVGSSPPELCGVAFLLRLFWVCNKAQLSYMGYGKEHHRSTRSAHIEAQLVPMGKPISCKYLCNLRVSYIVWKNRTRNKDPPHP